MKFGLQDSDIEKMEAVFERYPQVAKAVIYGSRAKGNYKRGSDIDLTLEGEALSLELLFKIEDSLDDLMLPYTIDLSISKNLGDADLREHVERVGKVFYEKGQVKA